MGTRTIRKIRNKEYLYYIYYENKQRREVCCGLVSDPKSNKKLKDTMLADLQKQKENITAQIKTLKLNVDHR